MSCESFARTNRLERHVLTETAWFAPNANFAWRTGPEIVYSVGSAVCWLGLGAGHRGVYGIETQKMKSYVEIVPEGFANTNK